MPTGKESIKLGVLGSGSGSNMQAILDAIEDGSLDAEIVLVLSDNPDAYILERARKAGIPAEVIDCRGYQTRFPEESQAAVAEKLKSLGVDVVCLAGFMRLVKQPLLDVFPNRILNIHPSLLPAYPGLMAWKQAVDQAKQQVKKDGGDWKEVVVKTLGQKPAELPKELVDSVSQMYNQVALGIEATCAGETFDLAPLKEITNTIRNLLEQPSS